MKIEVSAETIDEIMFQKFLETFDTFMQPSTDLNLIGLTVEQMDDVLSGIVKYSKWVSSPSERQIINERWLAWKKYKMILEED